MALIVDSLLLVLDRVVVWIFRKLVETSVEMEIVTEQGVQVVGKADCLIALCSAPRSSSTEGRRATSKDEGEMDLFVFVV